MRITRKPVYAALAGVGIMIGAAGLASAATGGSSTTPPAAEQAANATQPTTDGTDEADGGDEHGDEHGGGADYTSSITVADDTEATSEADEQATLAGLAAISADDASAAALATQPGTVSSVTLENENGNVVYTVEIDTNTGTVEVTIDAGNATVLATETDDGDHDGDHEGAGDAADESDQNEAPGTETNDD